MINEEEFYREINEVNIVDEDRNRILADYEVYKRDPLEVNEQILQFHMRMARTRT